MSLESGNKIFGQVCDTIVDMVHYGKLTALQGEVILVELIEALQDAGWDTEIDSFKEYEFYSFVTGAFISNDVGNTT